MLIITNIFLKKNYIKKHFGCDMNDSFYGAIFMLSCTFETTLQITG